jgi:hypothetical protein
LSQVFTEHEETVRGATNYLIAEHRETQSPEATREDVEEEEGVVILVVIVLGFLVDQDPMSWAETDVGDRGE